MELPYTEMVMPEERVGLKKYAKNSALDKLSLRYLLKHLSGEISPIQCAI